MIMENILSTPIEAQQALLQDASLRDLTTSRRTKLLETLWHERYLTRAQLISRVEGLLGKGCFGEKAWRDTFYRDMSVVKSAFICAGHRLAYSRRKRSPGYYLKGKGSISKELEEVIKGSVQEVDELQLSIVRGLSTSERFMEGCSISNLARQVVAHRIRQRKMIRSTNNTFRNIIKPSIISQSL